MLYINKQALERGCGFDQGFGKLIAQPRLTLRIAFAGNRELDEPERVAQVLDELFAAISEGLVAALQKSSERSTLYDSNQKPLLRLITGLAEGADAIAVDRLNMLGPAIDSEVAAVLPFSEEAFRKMRPDDHREVFDRQLRGCSYVVQAESDFLDLTSASSRKSAYKNQADYLLRQADLLVAVADPMAAIAAGGTLDTRSAAMERGIPVIFVDARQGNVTVSARHDRIAESVDTWAKDAVILLESICVPDNPTPEVEDEIKEFFGESATDREPPFRQRLWSRFRSEFEPASTRENNAIDSPYEAYRKKASVLSAHYIGLYRGAFLLNYRLAVVAVLCAVASMALMATMKTSLISLGVLLVLASAKLLVVILLNRNTIRANGESWNRKAIKYRYLAERFRTAAYMAGIGVYRAQMSMSRVVATRRFGYGQFDSVFQAITRHVSPAQMHASGANGRTAVMTTAHVRSVLSSWLQSQIEYHADNASVMKRMDDHFERVVRILAASVIVIVAVDIAVLCFEIYAKGVGTEVPHWLHGVMPWVVALTALFPAAIASYNGLRFQSESDRLKRRSAILVQILSDFSTELDPQTNDLSRLLVIAEDLELTLVNEVSEWSVLYDREVMEL